ncbi:MAG: hypothetical protein ACYC7L_17155 [Nitrospirota bacterium]
MRTISIVWSMFLFLACFSTSVRAADVPLALKDRKISVVTSGGVRYSLGMTVPQLLSLMKQQNAKLRWSWEKGNNNYYVLVVQGYDPMSGNNVRTGFGFALLKRDPGSVYLSAMTVNGVQVPDDEIVAFGIIMAQRHDPEYEPGETD